MIVIDNVLVSDDVVEKQFVCDLGKCKGGCCEDGDAGAPLEKEELDIILEVYEKVKPYLTADAIAEIERKGKYQYDREFGWVTPTLAKDHEICVYGIRDKNGVIAKPGKHGDYANVNYAPREKMCSPACALGEELKIPAYQFLKEPLIRKFGEDFYEVLDNVAKQHYEVKEK